MHENGSKIILFSKTSLITILRDNITSIEFPNFWDLPGGGIERDETPREALLREVNEELGLILQNQDIVWEKEYSKATGFASYFFAAPITEKQISQIQFGDEGQKWELMPAHVFCNRDDTVPHFRPRVEAFFKHHSLAL